MSRWADPYPASTRVVRVVTATSPLTQATGAWFKLFYGRETRPGMDDLLPWGALMLGTAVVVLGGGAYIIYKVTR